MVNYENDYIYGEKQEQKVFKIIEDSFELDSPLQKGTRYSKYDYYNNEINFELKSRKNQYNTYPTTMITMNKTSTDKELILVFNFTDGVYCIQYDSGIFSEFEVKPFSRAGIKTDEKPHYFIPVNKLEILHRW
jgi:hypothetical protein